MAQAPPSTSPQWLTRPLALGLALMAAKVMMLGGEHPLELTQPLVWAALMHDHFLIVMLFVFVNLFFVLKSRSAGPESEAVAHRAMWFLHGLALLWVAASVPIAARLGAPSSLLELRQAGGVTAVIASSLSVKTGAYGLALFIFGFASAFALQRVARGRVITMAIILGAFIATAGPMARESYDLGGLERDPFAIVIQSIWQGLEAIGNA